MRNGTTHQGLPWIGKPSATSLSWSVVTSHCIASISQHWGIKLQSKLTPLFLEFYCLFSVMKPNISASDCVPWYWSYITASSLISRLTIATCGQRLHSLLHMTSVTLRQSCLLSVEALWTQLQTTNTWV